MTSSGRVLVVFVDALGPKQVERTEELWRFVPHQRTLTGVLGYTSGALPTILTGVEPSVHGRMCLFSHAENGQSNLLSPLRWLGLLPKIVHERRHVRQLVEAGLKKVAGLTGYVALHRVPPEHFTWLDLPERDDMFVEPVIGGQRTFLADARDAGLSVYASRWQVPEAQRWNDAIQVLRKTPPDLAFLNAGRLDSVLHMEGNHGTEAERTVESIAQRIHLAREAMSQDGAALTTLVVGDHGMADIDLYIDSRSLLGRLKARVFVDSTMIRLWGSDEDLSQARLTLERSGYPGRWFDDAALASANVPTRDFRFGKSMFVLREGAMFSPSFLGGSVAGMHGYSRESTSASAALLSDRPLPPECTSLASLAGLVRRQLQL